MNSDAQNDLDSLSTLREVIDSPVPNTSCKFYQLAPCNQSFLKRDDIRGTPN